MIRESYLCYRHRGFYLARVKIDEEKPRPDGQKDKNSYESTHVFQVFNRP
jgi:hypothetical protein